jgi:hypothetical protein
LFPLGARVIAGHTGEAGTVVSVGRRILHPTSSQVCDVLMDSTGEVRTYAVTALRPTVPSQRAGGQ